jgi:hypothetical protein
MRPTELLGRALARAEALAGSRRGAVVLFAAALAVYAVQSIAWPLGPGRDLGSYLRYYGQLTSGDVLFPQAMLGRTPVAPVVAGGLLDAGGAVAEIVMALLFAASIVAWGAAALTVGRRVALAVAIALLLCPSYGALFHALSSDSLFAAGFAGWALLLARALARPSAAWFAALGVGVALLSLIRPSGQALAGLALVAFFLPGSLRARATWAASFLAAAALGLVSWATVNELRYDDFTVARGGNAAVPFFRAFTTDRIVSPDNGPASRELAEAVERDLLPHEPYRSYGIDLNEFFSSGSGRMMEDTVTLSDRFFGWDTEYEVLGRAGREAVRRHPGTYARGVVRSLWQALHHPLFGVRPGGGGEGGGAPAEPETIVVDGRELPKPTDGEPIPASYQSPFTSTPDGSVREVWTSPTEHRVVFADPRDGPRYEELQRRIGELFRRFPDRAGSAWLDARLDDAARLYPRAWLLILVGAVALAIRRPTRWLLPVALSAAALFVLFLTVLGFPSVPEYAVPFVPAFVLLAAAGLLGDRSYRRPTKPAVVSSTKAGATGSR